MYCSDSDRHWSQDICPPNSQIVQKNFIKVTLIIKECPEEILIKLTIVLKISMSSKPNKLSWIDQSEKFLLYHSKHKQNVSNNLKLTNNTMSWIFIVITN